MPAAWTSTCWWTRPSAAPGATALDVGTGAGHTALALAPHVRLVLALDITPEMLAEARRLGAANGVANLRLVEGAVEAVPVRPRSCDIVTCRVAAHHFRAADKAIAEMARVLRPGGRLLLVDNYAPDRPELDEFINRLEVLRDPSHVREHTLAQWQGFMAAADLRVEIRALDCIRLEFADWVRPLADAAGRGATAAGDAVIGIAGGRPHVRHHGRAAVDVLALAVHCGGLRGLTGTGQIEQEHGGAIAGAAGAGARRGSAAPCLLDVPVERALESGRLQIDSPYTLFGRSNDDGIRGEGPALGEGCATWHL